MNTRNSIEIHNQQSVKSDIVQLGNALKNDEYSNILLATFFYTESFRYKIGDNLGDILDFDEFKDLFT